MAINKELRNLVKQLHTASLSIPRRWDGRDSITEMKNSGNRHWRQMEWMGFYFEFLCERKFEGVLRMPGISYGRTEFDGFNSVCWDFKAHAGNTTNHQVITNDTSAVESTIEDYGHYGLILASGIVEYNDDARTFKEWHDALKGGPSDYELARINRGANSRRRKTEFVLEEIHFICLDADALNQCSGSFQEGFRNSDGSPRQSKVLVNVTKIPDSAIVLTAEFAQDADATEPC